MFVCVPEVVPSPVVQPHPVFDVMEEATRIGSGQPAEVAAVLPQVQFDVHPEEGNQGMPHSITSNAEAYSWEPSVMQEGAEEVNLTRALYSAGLLHVLNNCLKDIGAMMQYFPIFETHMKNICLLLARPWLKKRFEATCFATEPAVFWLPLLKGVSHQFYSGRWESLINCVGQLLRLSSVIRSAWSADKFSHGAHNLPAAEDD